jgi:hypothetical protein
MKKYSFLVIICFIILSSIRCSKDDIGYRPYLIAADKHGVSGYAGDTIGLRGYNLTYDSTAERHLTINDQKIKILWYNKDSLQFIVPPKVGSGAIILTVGNYTTSWGPGFNYLAQAVVTTIAGTGTTGNNDGAGSSATFNYPAGIGIDDRGMLYVADCYNQSIRKISTTDYTVSSISIPVSISDQTFKNPMHLSVNKLNHTIYVSGMDRNLLWMDLSGKFEVIYAEKEKITGVAAGVDNYVYISIASENTILRMDAGGGNRSQFRTNVSAPGALVYVWDYNQLIYSNIDSINQISIEGSFGFNTTNKGVDGWGFVIDRFNDYYLADPSCNCIRKYEPVTHTITTIAGSGAAADEDGRGLAASFDSPRGITTDTAGNLYVTTYNTSTHTGNKIRKISFE